jgi:NADPH2:quinone reductase
MNVAEIVSSDGHFILAPGQRPRPEPGPGEVLIEVFAAGVNGHDVHQLHRGGHPIEPGETDLPGLEVAGRVAGLGAGVTAWSIGDSVCALLRGGGYAEYATALEGNCLPVPQGLDWVQAASLPETLFTVWSNVVVDCGLSEGESFLMNGGTSGIGVTAIQALSALGYTVFATARGADKARFCERLGAQRGIDYETEDFPTVIAQETGGKGVNVILDIVGGDYLGKDLDALASGGRLVFIGAARGFRTEVDIQKLMRKRLRLCGSLLRPRPPAYKAQVAQALKARVWPLIESGRFVPVVDRTYPLAEAAAAIAHLEARQHIGKVILVVREAPL